MEDVSIVLSGAAGLGIQTVENILVKVFKHSGYNVFASKEYMSRVRGGINSTQIRVSSTRVAAYVDRIDILIPLNEGAFEHVEKKVSQETTIIGDREHLESIDDLIDVPFLKMAEEIGGRIYSNVIAAGVLSGILAVDKKILADYITHLFSKKGEEVVKKDLEAVEKGHEIGEELKNSGKIKIKIEGANAHNDLILSGTEAAALGAIAGGCNFVSSYPMTPSTGAFVFLAQHAEDFEIIIEQAEDEIAAINMAIGAGYAGARAMTTTSGGGFALMEEAVSLSGIIETPVVIYLAQRPGPAVGLPTRTEQGDLELALYSGHGEFPRIILAPGKIEDAFYLTQKAFNLADKFQIPVFLLTDQYLADLHYNVPSLDLEGIKVEKSIEKTKKDYKRFKLTDNGISPRGVPGYGDGLVLVDSDEHDEAGHITEDHDVKINMVEKRLLKLEEIKKEVIPPELVGKEDYTTLVVGWGSTYGPIKESIEKYDDISFLHFKQVYPLHPDTADYLKKAEKSIIFENNATSQFGKLIKLYTGIEIQEKILKYNGLPFTVEEVKKALEEAGK
jgi:2-oxoglutarate ferredoxin oxidoreductase subunit alpha